MSTSWRAVNERITGYSAEMAKRVETIVTLIDDLDSAKADRTIAFAFDGKSYEIDL